MKILFLYDFPLWGTGSATYLRNLVQELLKFNHKIGIVCPEERRFLEEKIKQYKVTLPQIPVFVAHPELKSAKKYSELSAREITEIYKAYLDTTLEAVANFEPDLIHVNHLSLISWIARYIYALTKVKYIITSHGSCLYSTIDDKRYMPLCEDALRKARAITVVSSDTKTKIFKSFKNLFENKTYRNNVRTIPGGININDYPLKLDTSSLDDKHGIKDKKIVFFTGRLISHKGVRYLIKAAKDIKGEILIAGEGPEKQYLLSLINRKKLKNVHFLGYLQQEELIEYYYRADVFVAPSVWDEPFGLTILEAMASRTPVIATRKGGIPSLVKDGQNGILVPSRNSKKIAEACNKLLTDEELRKKMGENARKTIEEKFTWKIIAMKFHRLYGKIFKNGLNNKKKK